MQFCPVLAVARISKSGQPLVCMCLKDGGTGAHDFSALAPAVPRGTQRAQAPRWLRPIRCLGQGPLAGGLARPINVEDEEVVSLSVPQSALLLLFHQRTGQQILEKKSPQGLDGGMGKLGEKATER